jgi:hypothetical protein
MNGLTPSECVKRFTAERQNLTEEYLAKLSHDTSPEMFPFVHQASGCYVRTASRAGGDFDKWKRKQKAR